MLDPSSRKALRGSIIDCIESTLNSHYGENVSQVIFHSYKARFGFSKLDIFSHPKEFEETLEAIFGTGLACGIIKATILKALTAKYEVGRADATATSLPIVIGEIVKNAC